MVCLMKLVFFSLGPYCSRWFCSSFYVTAKPEGGRGKCVILVGCTKVSVGWTWLNCDASYVDRQNGGLRFVLLDARGCIFSGCRYILLRISLYCEAMVISEGRMLLGREGFDMYIRSPNLR